MLKKGMIVRIPSDLHYPKNPREFIFAKVENVDVIKETVSVAVYDPFNLVEFYRSRLTYERIFNFSQIKRASLPAGSLTVFDSKIWEVISFKFIDDNFSYYYLKNIEDNKIQKVAENDIIPSFDIGEISPLIQLEEQEFKNPVWYRGRSIVSKTTNLIENSLHGLKQLAGSKIMLLPHQLETTLKILFAPRLRFMLADEVGMGKSIEALSVLKIYMDDHSDKSILLIMPDSLAEQWKLELKTKFNLRLGNNIHNNYLEVCPYSQISVSLFFRSWDFLIIDEVHRFLYNERLYSLIARLSKNVDNVLLLSATPLKSREQEYRKLLRLIDPDKFDQLSDQQFSQLLKNERKISALTSEIYTSLDELKEELGDEFIEDNLDPDEKEAAEELQDEISEYFDELIELLDDSLIVNKIRDLETLNLSTYISMVGEIVAYISANYQIGKNIIRNRRQTLRGTDDNNQLMAERKLIQLPYELNPTSSPEEYEVWIELTDWFTDHSGQLDFCQEVMIPLSESFGSSAHAFQAELENLKQKGYAIPEELDFATREWRAFEDQVIIDIRRLIDDPDLFPEYQNSRIYQIFNFLNQEAEGKSVLMTSFDETYKLYREAINKLYLREQTSFFSAQNSNDENEMDVWRFQNNPECQVLLSDRTGGEGRNFQIADYLIHIDLPWDAANLEQRIGRLDRLDRDPKRMTVYSVIPYPKETIQEEIFDLWDKGLNIFKDSLSGMEIIMGDIDRLIRQGLSEDYEYGLKQQEPILKHLMNKMQETLKKERINDSLSSEYLKLKKSVEIHLLKYQSAGGDLFRKSLLGWASLAGFNGQNIGNDQIRFSPKSFSVASAKNTFLRPPNWDSYLSKQNEFEKILNPHGNLNRSIIGTFNREIAVKSDYLHFFAPGDDIYDCIVNNAIFSDRGQCTAFSIKSDAEWQGFVFTFDVTPDFNRLFENNLTVHKLNPYRHYVFTGQIQVAVATHNPGEIDPQDILDKLNSLLENPQFKNKIRYLGARGKYCNSDNYGRISKADYFTIIHPPILWRQQVRDSYLKAAKTVIGILKSKADLRALKDEMQKSLITERVQGDYYQVSNHLETIKQEQDIVYQALIHPYVKIVSASYIEMGVTDE